MTYQMTDDDDGVCEAYGHAMLPLAEFGPMSTAALASYHRECKTPFGSSYPWQPKMIGWTTRTTASLLNQVRHHHFPVEFDGKVWTLHEPTELHVAVAMLAAFKAAHFDSRPPMETPVS
jgi:hypothetical protein